MSVILSYEGFLVSCFLPITCACQPPVLVLAPAPAGFSACLCSRQELFPLCGCCDPEEGGKDSRRVSELKGKAVWPLWVWLALWECLVSVAVGVEEVKQAQAVQNTLSFVATGIPCSFLIRLWVARGEYVVEFTVAPNIIIDLKPLI